MLAQRARPSAARYQRWRVVELAGWGRVSILEGSSRRVVELACGRVDWHLPTMRVEASRDGIQRVHKGVTTFLSVLSTHC